MRAVLALVVVAGCGSDDRGPADAVERACDTICAPYRCDLVQGRCLTTCAGTGDWCASGYSCNAQNQCVAQPRADGLGEPPCYAENMSRRGPAIWLGVLAGGMTIGCGRLGFESTVDGGPSSDGMVCTPTARACGCWTTPPSNFDPCSSCAPTTLAALVLAVSGVYTYTTDTGVLTDPLGVAVAHDSSLEAQLDSSAARVVWAAELDIPAGSTLEVHGSLPLIIAIEGPITLAGEIDVSAWGSEPGPGGGNPADCALAAGADASANSGDIYGGSGGGGGALGAAGGQGGDGWGVGAIDNGGAAGGVSGDTQIVPLRGGCDGGRGRDGWTTTGNGFSQASRGRAGGAIQLSSCAATNILGTVRATGGGGRGGGMNPSVFASGGGGGGGGAGGAILIESGTLQVTMTAKLCANGGAGGEGGSEAVAGADGPEGTCGPTGSSTPDNIAEGGAGGTGGSLTAIAGSAGGVGQPQNGGGGGGGGGVGRIHLSGWSGMVIDPGAIVSPATQ